MWYVITYPLTNFNSAFVEVLEWKIISSRTLRSMWLLILLWLKLLLVDILNPCVIDFSISLHRDVHNHLSTKIFSTPPLLIKHKIQWWHYTSSIILSFSFLFSVPLVTVLSSCSWGSPWFMTNTCGMPVSSCPHSSCASLWDSLVSLWWRHQYWPLVRWIHRALVESPPHVPIMRSFEFLSYELEQIVE